MSIAARFRHTFVIEKFTEGATTQRGHKVVSYPDQGTIKGLAQERKGGSSEVTAPDQGERVIAIADIFLPLDAAVTARDRLRRSDTGVRYELVGPLRDAGGRGRHLQVEARRVTP